MELAVGHWLLFLFVVLVIALFVASKIKSPTQNDLDFAKGKEHATRGYDRDKGQSEAYNDGYSSYSKSA